MRTIHKYELKMDDTQKIKIPKLKDVKDFKQQVMKIGSQNEKAYIWCLIDTEEETQEVSILIFGTGSPMPLLTKEDYLGDFTLHNGKFVGYVFLEK